jgi:hypothetical protein
MDVTGQATAALAERYRRFASEEARGSSPLYEALSNHVAEAPALLWFLSQFPAELQQPNLFLAAVRHVAGTPSGPENLEDIVRRNGASIAQTMRTRSTQTNEPGRCAALLPVLSAISDPIALLEVGASAGLCLLPDKYAYDYGRLGIGAPDDTRAIAPVLQCDASANTPLPRSHPTVAWRAGLDLTPRSVRSADDMAWLETLVWPEQDARLARLRSAVSVARMLDPGVIRGDLRKDLTELASRAPARAKLVIFHTAVLAYVTSQDDRDAFARACRDLGATWICNEFPYVYPWIAEGVRGPHRPGMFLLSVDGRPLAWTAPHGQRIEWL